MVLRTAEWCCPAELGPDSLDWVTPSVPCPPLVTGGNYPLRRPVRVPLSSKDPSKRESPVRHACAEALVALEPAEVINRFRQPPRGGRRLVFAESLTRLGCSPPGGAQVTLFDIDSPAPSDSCFMRLL